MGDQAAAAAEMTMTRTELVSLFFRPAVSFHLAVEGARTMWCYWRRYRRARRQETAARIQEEQNKRRAAQFLQESHNEAKCSKRVGLAAAITVAAVAILYLFLLVLYTRIHPSVPVLDVVNASVNHLVDAGTTWNVSLGFTVSVSNTNRHLELHGDYVEVSASSYGVQLGSSKTRAFVQPRRSKRTMDLTVMEPAMDVPLLQRYDIHRDAAAGAIPLIVHLTLKARMSTLPGIKSSLVWSRVRCRLHIGESITHKECALE